MPKPKVKIAPKAMGSVVVKGGPKIKKKWCHGTIWFDDLGCLHIEDEDLGSAVLLNYLETGKLCISVKSDFSPSNNLNLQCAC